MNITKLIAFEGIDGSGKTVQFNRLRTYLLANGYSVETKEYPAYSGFFGSEIGSFLAGDNSVTAMDVDPKSMALWFAMDRFQDIKDFVDGACDFLLINRYTLSNMVYQSMRHDSEGFGLVNWIYELEHDVLGLPVPDAYVLFDVEEVRAGENIDKKGFRDYVGIRKDVYEQSEKIQTGCRARYLECARHYGNIIKIECMESGKLMREEVIADKVLTELRSRGLL